MTGCISPAGRWMTRHRSESLMRNLGRCCKSRWPNCDSSLLSCTVGGDPRSTIRRTAERSSPSSCSRRMSAFWSGGICWLAMVAVAVTGSLVTSVVGWTQVTAAHCVSGSSGSGIRTGCRNSASAFLFSFAGRYFTEKLYAANSATHRCFAAPSLAE